jgi:YHS domain-containing protein
MVRLRQFFAPPGRLRPWATGLALATASPALAAPSAVETLDAAVARELGEADQGSGIRQVSGESGDVSPYAPRPLRRPSGTPRYSRPAANPQAQPPQMLPRTPGTSIPRPTYETRPGMSRSYATQAGSRYSGVQQMSSSPDGGDDSEPSYPSDTTRAASKSPGFFGRITGRGSSPSSTRRTSTTRKTSTSTTSGGGLFGQMLRPFGREEEQRPVVKEQPPVPPALPPYAPPARMASQPSAPPRPMRTASAVPLTPGPPATFDGSSALPEIHPNPFGEVAETEVATETAPTHPLADEFGDVRGQTLPEEEAVGEVDPDFATPVQISEHGAPRPLDPEAVETANDFAPVREPAAEPQQSPAARYAELQRKLAERSGLGGFQGFCPVALRDRRELVDARPEFLSVYKNRTYELSSAEAKARFEADPARYAPVNGGRDAVLTSRGETEAEGNLAHAVWFKDRLYLFRSAETLKQFNADPARYAVAE